MISFERSNSLGMLWQPEIEAPFRDEAIYAIKTYAFLLDCNRKITAQEFADTIDSYVDYEQGNLRASQVRALSFDLNTQEVIGMALKHDIQNGMCPSVFKAILLNGKEHVGFNFQPIGTKVGHRFHFDHGVGINRNEDAEVIWMKF